MDQISTYSANQSQQPEHDKQRDNRPQHYCLLLIIPNCPAYIASRTRLSLHFEEVQGVCRTRRWSIIKSMYAGAPYCDTAKIWRQIFVISQIVSKFTGGRREITR
jgi:hypothetical protein